MDLGKTLFNVSHAINIKLTKQLLFNREFSDDVWFILSLPSDLKPSLKQDKLLSFEIVPYFTKHHCEEAQFSNRTEKKQER